MLLGSHIPPQPQLGLKKKDLQFVITYAGATGASQVATHPVPLQNAEGYGWREPAVENSLP